MIPLSAPIQRSLLAATLLAYSGGVSAEPPAYTLFKTDQAITVDGILDESLWRSIDTMRLVSSIVGAPRPQTTAALAAWDATYLYIAMIAHDTDIASTIFSNDGDIYNEDALEFFIDPDGDQKNYFEYEFNCNGAYMDMFMRAPYSDPNGGGDISWSSSGLTYAQSVVGTVNSNRDRDSLLVIEASIPWRDLSFDGISAPTPSGGNRYKANFYRIDARESSNQTLSAWSPVGGSFHVPALFGTLVVSDSIVPTNQTTLGAMNIVTRSAITSKTSGTAVCFSVKNSSSPNLFITIYTLSGKSVGRIDSRVSQDLIWDRKKEGLSPGIYCAKITTDADAGQTISFILQ